MSIYAHARPALGAVPVVPLVGMAAASAAIGGLALLVQNALADDWADQTVFTSHAREIHSAMLGIQCMIGGAPRGEYLVDTLGNLICTGGTVPVCKLSATMVAEWRTLRDGFSIFWLDVSNKYSGPSNAEATRLKAYATQFYGFYKRIALACSKQNVVLPSAPLPPEALQKPSASLAPGWLKWSVGGLAVIAVIVGIRTFGR